MPHNTLFIKVSQIPSNPKGSETKVRLMVRYDAVGMSGPIEFSPEQILATLNIDGIVVTYPDGSLVAWPPEDPRWRLDD